MPLSARPLVQRRGDDGATLRSTERICRQQSLLPFSYAKGNVEEGFKKADHVFEDTFRFPRVQHFSMEPHATVAACGRESHHSLGRTQEPFTLREHLSEFSIYR